jgi:hypothetical protein
MKIVAVVVVAAAGALLATMFPELRRYLKMERM